MTMLTSSVMPRSCCRADRSTELGAAAGRSGSEGTAAASGWDRAETVTLWAWPEVGLLWG
jgi:hypothetical protein